MRASQVLWAAVVVLTGCATNPSKLLDPAGYCRRKTENWTIAWTLVGQPTSVLTEVYGQPAAKSSRDDGYTELMFWKRGQNYHLDNATHFIVDPAGQVIAWHDPAPEFLLEGSCEAWRRKSCPTAPECGRDPNQGPPRPAGEP